jgi:hypothetical protein
MSKKKPGRKKPEPAKKKVQHLVLQPVRTIKPARARAEDLHAIDRREQDPPEELEQPVEELLQNQPPEELLQEQGADRGEDLDQEKPAEDLEPAINPLLLASVNGTVVDTSGNPWGYAVVQFSLLVQGGGKPVEISTGLVIPTPAPIVCDGSGNFTTALQKTDSIVPPGTMWQLTIFPFNNQHDGQTLTPFTMTGALNLSSMIASQLAPHVDQPLIVPMSNSGTNGQSTLNGSMFFDVETGTLFLRVPSAAGYVTLGFAGGNVTFGNVAATNLNVGHIYVGGQVPPFTLRDDGASSFIDAGATGRLLINYGVPGAVALFGNDGSGAPTSSIDATGAAKFATSIGVGLNVGGTFQFTVDTNASGGVRMLSINPASATQFGSYTLRAYSSDFSATVDYLTCFFNTGTGRPDTIVSGDFSATGTKAFRIPHPLITGKDLVHACIEGPEAAVFYRGEGVTVNGRAVIELPDYFEALTMKGNRTVHLTIQVSDEDPVFGGAIAAGRVVDGSFKVYSTDPSTRFYWEVKAVRDDLPRLQVVADKQKSAGGA